MSLKMSLTENKTRQLWQNFMPFRSKINNRMGEELYAVQIYNDGHFIDFEAGREFVKWAAVEVESWDDIPDPMQPLGIPEGLYAVFLHKGAASSGDITFKYIFQNWLPGSDYDLDNRPHFEVLGSKYKNDDPDSEEEIWLPVKPRSIKS